MSRPSKFLIISCLVAISASAQPLRELAALQNLSGTWKMGSGAKSFYEHWHWVSANEISGKSYKLKEQDTIVFESTRIKKEDKLVNYLATVKNQNEGKEIAFKLDSSANGKLVFENPNHDFPQRIVYQFISTDSLHAWVEGMRKGMKEREDYYYARVK